MLTKFKKLFGFKVILVSLLLGIFVLSATITMTTRPKDAQAVCCSDCCTCLVSTLPTDISGWFQDFLEINLHLFLQLLLHRWMWFDWTFWQANMLPLFMQMGSQLGAVGTHQVMIIGMFIDAQEQMETQRLLQELHARANKDYQPSRGMCEFGTRVLSLAATERMGEANALILSERSSDRFLGNKDTGASGGTPDDIEIRLGSFQSKYCDSRNNSNSLGHICPTIALSTGPGQAVIERFNRDVDYQKVVEDAMTIDFDLTAGGAPSLGDEDVVAMANNLYGFDTFTNVDPKEIQNAGNETLSSLQEGYLKKRAVVAKTKVAENSFNALMALKGTGTAGSRDFLESYLEELGMPGGADSEVEAFLGPNPSYHAQMEILTKLAYQSPLFYTNLYDKPANVKRKEVAMQAIGLIQKFDLLKSYLRTEASLSVLLELSVDQQQRAIEDNILDFDGKSSVVQD